MADLVDLARDHIGVGGAEQELRRRSAASDSLQDQARSNKLQIGRSRRASGSPQEHTTRHGILGDE